MLVGTQRNEMDLNAEISHRGKMESRQVDVKWKQTCEAETLKEEHSRGSV